jgi:hypothetical protein
MNLVGTSSKVSSPVPQWPGTLHYDTNDVGSPNVVTYATFNSYNSDSGPYAWLVLLTLDSADYQLRQRNYSPRMRRWRTCNHGCGLCQSFADGSEGAPAVAAAGFDN